VVPVSRIVVALVACCAWSAFAAPPRASDTVILATTVAWTDADGQTGSAKFQGSARGKKLTGILQGDGTEEVRVRGTIERDGRITGSLTTPDGAPVGTFSGRVNEQGKLDGSWLVEGGAGGGLAAPADAVPIRGRRPPQQTEPPKDEPKPAESAQADAR